MNICNHHVDSQRKHPKQICVLEKGMNTPPPQKKKMSVYQECTRTCACVSESDGGILTLRIHFPNSRRSKIQFPTLATSGAHQ